MDTCGQRHTPPTRSRSGAAPTWHWGSHRRTIAIIIIVYILHTTSSEVCDRIYSANAGEIVSPQYPSSYPQDVYCTYRISRPTAGPIMLTFLLFHLEYDDDCDYDFVRVYDGPDINSPSLATYCGSDAPPIHTSTNQATIVFHSDSSVTDEGFRIYYSGSMACTMLGGTCSFSPCVSPTHDSCEGGATCCMASSSDQCSRKITSSYGILESPNYPANYDNNLDCIYTITRPDSVVAITFEVFELEAESSCNYDYVKVHDGENVQWPRIALFCGTDAHNIISKGQHLTIHFHSDSSVTKKGFRLVWGGSNCAFWGGVCTSVRCDLASDYSCPDGQYCCRQDCDLYQNKICPDGSCLGYHVRCDSFASPLPGGVSCPTYAKMCPDGTCISGEFECPCASHQVQCWDGSCALSTTNCDCGPLLPHICANRYGCFNDTQNCNGVEDCHDGSDELNCEEESHSLTWVYGLIAVTAGVLFLGVMTICSKRHKQRMRTGSHTAPRQVARPYQTATLAGLGAQSGTGVLSVTTSEQHGYDNLAMDAPPPYGMHTFYDMAPPPSYETTVAVFPTAPPLPDLPALPPLLTAENPPAYESVSHINSGVFIVGGVPQHKPADESSRAYTSHAPLGSPTGASNLPRVDTSPVHGPTQGLTLQPVDSVDSPNRTVEQFI